MSLITLTKKQARQFILLKQGLMGEYRFKGKEGVMDFVHQAGCVQFDPIDVCGKNPELVFQSRVEGFTKEMLYSLLYDDRKLLDYFDKNLAIIDINHWKYFERIREENRQQGRGRDEIEKVAHLIKAIINEKGPASSKDIGFNEKIDWYWSSTNLSRAALETLYFRGDLIVHHKKGTIKYYALAEDYIPREILTAKDPHDDEIEHMKWRVLRRISAVGMLWNKASDAWLYIRGFKTKERNIVFQQLLDEGKIFEFAVEGVKENLYCLTTDKGLIDTVRSEKNFHRRTELIAPLDSFIWDRKLIKEIFGFEYKWEIYTPVSQRKYGYYVLPIISGDRFVGRTEAVCDRKNKVLNIKGLWLENGVQLDFALKQRLEQCFTRFMLFHGLEGIEYQNNL